MARTRSARMRLPRRQWEDEGTRSNIALVAQADPKRSFLTKVLGNIPPAEYVFTDYWLRSEAVKLRGNPANWALFTGDYCNRQCSIPG